MGMAKEAARMVFITDSPVGHLTPMVELAKHILRIPQMTTTHHDFAITIITIPLLGCTPDLSAFVSASSLPNLSFLQLQPIGPPPSADLSFQAIATSIDLYIPVVRSSLQTLHSSSPIIALVSGFFCSCTIDVGVELGIPTYAFFPIGAAQLGLLLHMDTIDPLIPNNPNALEVAGKTIVPVPGFSSSPPLSALPDAVLHGKDDLYHWFLQHGLRFLRAKGILVNTFALLEPAVIEALEEGLYVGRHSTPPVYPVGPLLPLEANRGDKHKCIEWLNGQPHGSVVFLCFGSMGSFSEAQVREMAIGLERSGHRFLWVMRDVGLPEGFEERTKERGLVWTSFAPQVEVLQHEAVGGFVTHCGWNSFLEAVWSGVPMAAWPLYAEQHFNAYVMVEEMGMAVGVRAERWEGNRVEAEEVERVVRLLMSEGSVGVREKVKGMGERARKALQEGVGSSYCTIQRLAKEWSTSTGR